MTGPQIDFGKQQDRICVVRIARDGLFQGKLCLIHIVIFK